MGTLAAAQVAEHLTQAAAGSVHHTGGIPHCLNSIVRIDFHAVHKYSSRREKDRCPSESYCPCGSSPERRCNRKPHSRPAAAGGPVAQRRAEGRRKRKRGSRPRMADQYHRKLAVSNRLNAVSSANTTVAVRSQAAAHDTSPAARFPAPSSPTNPSVEHSCLR